MENRPPMNEDYVLNSIDGARSGAPIRVLEVLRCNGVIDDTTFSRLNLALQEAFANSLEHGNLELESIWKEEISPDGTDRFTEMKRERLQQEGYGTRLLRVSTNFDGGRLQISIKDDGPGFSFGDVGVPLTGTEAAIHGRGLALICNAFDEVTYFDGGSRITMVKFIRG